MKHAILAAAAVCSICTTAFAQDRLTDGDVKGLVARIEDGRDKFDDALDGDLKNKVLRGPNGEVNVKNFLDDFQKNIDRLEERLKPDYAASAEVATLLKQGTSIDNFFRQHAPGTRGESEWNRLAADLKALGGAYGAPFPLAENAPVRRIGDGEVAETAEMLSKSASQLKKSLDADLKKSTTIDKAARAEIVQEADDWVKEAKALKSRVKDGKPSSGEAQQLLSRASRLQSFIKKNQLPAATSAWAGVDGQVQAIASAYNKSWGSAQ
jgi:hypothetical protein